MSAQTPTTPKGARNPRRNNKRTTTPRSYGNNHFQDSQNSNHFTPPRRSPRNTSPEIATNTEGSAYFSEGGHKKKKNHYGKNNKEHHKTPNGNSSNNRRPTSPQGLKDSPHYAGPTFHASPAPSALPIPTFLSKSVPDSDIAKSESSDEHEHDDKSLGSTLPAFTPTKPRTNPLVEESAQDSSSPLDFLFKAAREAKAAKQNGDGETRSGTSSPINLDRPKPVPLQAEGTPGGVFPLELESPKSHKMDIGPAFATPYKDRMNALRSPSSSSRPNSNEGFDEEQRKVKSEALKSLLMKPRSQDSSPASPRPRDPSNIFNSSYTTPNGTLKNGQPTRHASNPTTPTSNDEKAQSMARTSIAHQYLTSVCNGSAQSKRAPSSNLRQELSSGSQMHSPQSPSQRVHLSRSSSAQSTFPRYSNQHSSNNMSSPTPTRSVSNYPHQSSPLRGHATTSKTADARRMEDDLRRILKLDASENRIANGVGNGIA